MTVLDWLGKKDYLLPEIRNKYPAKFNTYHEPFLGSGAVFFNLLPEKAILNDINAELINCYKQIKENPEKVIEELKKLKNTKEDFYKIRNLDRKREFKKLPPEIRAARMIYLNKFSFPPGFWRENSKGYANIAYGYSKKELTEMDFENIRNTSKRLRERDISFYSADFEFVICLAEKDDFVFLDPPYIPFSETANFTKYNSRDFKTENQLILRKEIELLSSKGVFWMLCNSDTPETREIFKGYNFYSTQISRKVINTSKGNIKVNELLITNYSDFQQQTLELEGLTPV